MIQLLKKEFITENGREKIITQMPAHFPAEQAVFLSTSTHEPFMPVRLYFKFLHKKGLIKALKRRNCIDWEDENQFIISYWEEARNIALSVPYDETPEEIFPILLASGRIVNASEIHVDVRSFKRAIEIIKFLYKQIGSQFLYITHVAAYNRYTDATAENIQSMSNLDFDELFSETNFQADSVLMKELVKDREDPEEIKNRWEEIMNKPIPAIQKIAVTGTKAELARLEFTLMMNMHMAQEYWQGNPDYTPADMINQFINSVAEDE